MPSPRTKPPRRASRRRAAVGQLDLFADRPPQRKTAADRANDRCGLNEKPAKALRTISTASPPPRRVFYAVRGDRGEFIAIASAPDHASARRSLFAGGAR